MRYFFFGSIFMVCIFSVFANAQTTKLEFGDVDVDLKLVLAVDVSGSVSAEIIGQQHGAFATAFRSEILQSALLSGPTGKTAVVYFEFSSFDKQRIVVPWTILSTKTDIKDFADALDHSTRYQRGGQTSISGAMFFAEQLLIGNKSKSLRKVVDITGNGPNNDGPPLKPMLHNLLAKDVIVNGLILPTPNVSELGPYDGLFSPSSFDIDEYFEDEVSGGPGSFVLKVDPSVGYLDAILRKLVLEVAWVSDLETTHGQR